MSSDNPRPPDQARRLAYARLSLASTGDVDALLVQRGVEILKAGGLVAFPTETVYGLGADARSPQAVERLYRVKGRPERHPVIVHVGSLEAARACAREFPERAERLAARFWPGPLTLIVPKADWVPDSVTGGQGSVGVRIPAHPLARRLLESFGGPVAAPSANRFGRVSPTTAEHVIDDLGEDVDAVLDGGPCAVGVESSIVDVRGPQSALLRPGGVPREALEEALGEMLSGTPAVRVSGDLPSHYAPIARVEVVDPARVDALAAEYRSRGVKVKVLGAGEVEARALYSSLRKADAEGAELVLAPRPSSEGLGEAVADRLRRASGPRG